MGFVYGAIVIWPTSRPLHCIRGPRRIMAVSFRSPRSSRAVTLTAAAELPLVLGTAYNVQSQEESPIEMAAQKYIQNAWIAFIKDPQAGLIGFGWPAYNPNCE